MGSLSRPFHSVGLGDEEIFCLSFSPYEWSKNFLAIGTGNKVVIANVQYENDEIQFNVIREFHHLCPVITLSWSALSSSDTVPKVCKFATAGIDGKIRIYSSDLAQSENILELSGHTDNVNCIAFQPDIDDKFLISTSDDFTCKIWSVENGDLLKTIPLQSSGMAVRFNPSEPSKFFVIEKSGVTTLFSTMNFSPVTSLSNNFTCQDPALDADWSSCNPTYIITALGGRIQHWNLNSLSVPEDTTTVSCEMVRKVRFHPTFENFMAVLSSPGPVVTVLRSMGPVMVTDSLMAANDLSWHFSLPLLAVANDRSVRFWKLLLK
ncbi:nucleoporin Nup37 [Daphnia magna]|uniref:nucleoporin Nup37 n=1 Tax=Daphnia magna TaxID=35525 RepID=UPI001E1BC5DE|nr:nucleoporin Nup37 [Daphnia magna]